MVSVSVSIDDFSIPQIVAEEKDFLIVYKPPRMHSVPQALSEISLLNWCKRSFPIVGKLSGRNRGEGGLLHRLDYETHGLMLLARTNPGMESLLEQQKQGKIIKEYSALTVKSEIALPGFPKEKPELPQWVFEGKADNAVENPVEIKSAFRPFGQGRKAVRPLLIGNAKNKRPGELYITEITKSELTSIAELGNCLSLKLKISKGFRHQIRSHLAWLGLPILNDTLYGGAAFGKGCLALRAFALLFDDPSTGEKRYYSIPPLAANDS